MTAFPVTDDGIKALRAKVLGALADTTYPKEALGVVARKYDITVDDVKALVEKHGYPDRHEMRRQAFELGAPAPAVTPAALVAARNGGAPKPAVAVATTVDPTAALIGKAAKSGKARTRKLAERAGELLEELRQLVEQEQKEAQIAEAERAQRAKLEIEVAELEEKLRKAKEELKGRKSTSAKKAAAPKAAGNSKLIREWAAAHGIECPQFGRIPADVREAYDLAQGGV